MTLDRRDPEYREIVDARLNEWRRQLSAGKISVHVFRAYLHSVGLRGEQISSEVAIHRRD